MYPITQHVGALLREWRVSIPMCMLNGSNSIRVLYKRQQEVNKLIIYLLCCSLIGRNVATVV